MKRILTACLGLGAALAFAATAEAQDTTQTGAAPMPAGQRPDGPDAGRYPGRRQHPVAGIRRDSTAQQNAPGYRGSDRLGERQHLPPERATAAAPRRRRPAALRPVSRPTPPCRETRIRASRKARRSGSIPTAPGPTRRPPERPPIRAYPTPRAHRGVVVSPTARRSRAKALSPSAPCISVSSALTLARTSLAVLLVPAIEQVEPGAIDAGPDQPGVVDRPLRQPADLEGAEPRRRPAPPAARGPSAGRGPARLQRGGVGLGGVEGVQPGTRSA